MSDDASVLLDPQIQKLAKDFVLENGRVVMPDERVVAWVETFAGLAPAKRAIFASQLIALAFKFARRAGDLAAIAITQLFVLACCVLESRTAAEKAFQQAGIDPKEAARLTGRTLDQIAPEPSKPSAGGVGLRKRKK